ELDPAHAGDLRRHPLLADAEASTKEQCSTYFDTKKNVLRKAGYSLRVRRSGGKYVQTVKRTSNGAGLFDRPEWETSVDNAEPNAEAVAATPLGEIIGADRISKLLPVVESRVDRTVWHLDHQKSKVELVLDEGTIRGGEEERPLHEVEIELKKGDPDAVLDLARKLAESVPLRLGVLSKAERGFALAEGRLDKVSKAAPVQVDAQMDVAAGFAAIVNACLRHFRLNERLVAGRREAEALHQARVAMRRLRSAFSLFRPAIRDSHYETLREELRWFTGTLGDARNLDVFLARGGGEGVEIDREALRAAREKAYDHVIEALESQRFRDLMLELVVWLEAGEWRGRRKARAPLPDFAEARLDRLWRKVRGGGREIASLDEEARHRLRIEVKKLRYAVEFLAGLYRSAALTQKRFATALEGMQESLGHLNDIATGRELLARLGLADGKDEAAQADPGEERRHLAEAEANFGRLARIGPFWR
ncbi:MAG: CHAD domain-containing protein, partial [Alphaproteobacteria bacterium]|nr:CHAD domain-containing protein [Alphaproteobacteria bacterium]